VNRRAPLRLRRPLRAGDPRLAATPSRIDPPFTSRSTAARARARRSATTSPRRSAASSSSRPAPTSTARPCSSPSADRCDCRA
jgi:hypothetical protein